MTDIIVVTYQAKENLKRCIDSIKKHTKNYLITIVDNHSDDGTADYINKLKEVRVIRNRRNLGFSKAANIALKNTSNEWVVFLDDDAKVTQGWLSHLYRQIKDAPRVGIVGCKMVLPDKRILLSDYFFDPAKDMHIGEIDRGQKDYIRECDALVGTCWLMRRQVFNRIGGFDESFFPDGFEDIDYCLRARLAGFKLIYDGKVTIIHANLHRWGLGGKNYLKMSRFKRKWKNRIRQFPLKDSHPLDKDQHDGILLLNKGNFKEALRKIKKLEQLDKRFSLPIYTGIAYEGLGQYENAVQYYKIAIKQFKKFASVHPFRILARYRLAFLYKKMDMNAKAHLLAKTVLRDCAITSFPWLENHYLRRNKKEGDNL